MKNATATKLSTQKVINIVKALEAKADNTVKYDADNSFYSSGWRARKDLYGNVELNFTAPRSTHRDPVARWNRQMTETLVVWDAIEAAGFQLRITANQNNGQFLSLYLTVVPADYQPRSFEKAALTRDEFVALCTAEKDACVASDRKNAIDKIDRQIADLQAQIAKLEEEKAAL